jgi:hypothetical protein
MAHAGASLLISGMHEISRVDETDAFKAHAFSMRDIRILGDRSVPHNVFAMTKFGCTQASNCFALRLRKLPIEGIICGLEEAAWQIERSCTTPDSSTDSALVPTVRPLIFVWQN